MAAPAPADATPTLRAPTARAVTLAILALGLLAVLAANLPGQLSYDSVVQLADARVGRYHTWHPAIMAWLLGLGDAILPGTAIYVTAVAALPFAAMALAVTAQPRVGWAAPVVALLICASPLVLLEQGIVWKDVLFADVSVAAFLLLAVAAGEACGRRMRLILLAKAAALLALAVLVRQNGVIVPVFAALGIAIFAWRRYPELGSRPRLLRASAVGGGALALVLVMGLAANAALMTRKAADDVGAGGQLRLLKLYDLVGVAKRDPGVNLNALHASGLDAHIRAAIPLYTPLQNDTISGEAGIDAAISGGAPGLDAAWRGALLHHTGAWLAHRVEVFRWIFIPPDVTRCTAVYSGVDGPPETLAQLNIASAWRAQDIKLAHYAQAFVRTPLYSHAAWAVLALVLIAALVSFPRTDRLIVALMLTAALAYTASYFLIGIACDHRYLYVLDLSTMAAGLWLACGLPERLRSWRQRVRREVTPASAA